MKAPTIKISLFKGKTLADGRYPVCIIVIKNGKTKRKSIASAFESEWDAKKCRIKTRSRKDFEKLNDDIEMEFEKYESNFKKLKRSDLIWDVEDVFDFKEKTNKGLLHHADEYLKHIAKRPTFTITSSTAITNKIKEYCKGKDVDIDTIGRKWVEGFEQFCQKKRNNANTIGQAIKYIKRIIKRSGFECKFLSTYSVSFDKVVKNKLTEAEISLIENVELITGSPMELARDTFMLQFYFRGMRIGDVMTMKKSNIANGKLTYTTGKTGTTHAMRIVEPALEIIKRYAENNTEYILPWIRIVNDSRLSEEENRRLMTNEIKNRTMKVNLNLKIIAEKCGIKKNVTTHIARHSFAVFADSRLNGNIKQVQEMLGHGSRAMTERYLAELKQSDLLDDAADKIFN